MADNKIEVRTYPQPSTWEIDDEPLLSKGRREKLTSILAALLVTQDNQLRQVEEEEDGDENT